MRRVAALVLGTLIGLGVVEVGLRAGARWIFIDSPVIPDADLGWVLRKSWGAWSTEENTVWATTNSAGYRDREHALRAEPGTRRIAVIGDSFIHGYYLELQDTFGASLERELSSCTRAPRVETLSFGVFGYNTAQELLMFRRDVARYRPDIVILAVFPGNDIVDNHPRLFGETGAPRFAVKNGALVLDTSFRDTLPKPPRWPLRRAVFEAVIGHVRAARLIKDTIDRLLEPRPGPAAPDPRKGWSIYQPPAPADATEAWSLTETLVAQFADEVRAAGAEFWLMPLFMPEQVHPEASVRRAAEARLGVDTLFYPTRRLETFARSHGIATIAVAEPAAAYALERHAYVMGGNTRETPPGTGHWNAVGTGLAAGIAARELCAQSAALTSP